MLFDARAVTPVAHEMLVVVTPFADVNWCVRHRNDKGLQHSLTTFYLRRDNEPPTRY